jgi:hypothetical protein
MLKRTFLAVFRLGFGALGMYALLLFLMKGLEQPGFDLLQFVSLFPIQAGFYASIILMVAGINAIRGEKSECLEPYRGAAVLYLVISALTYPTQAHNGLLSPFWSAGVLWYVLPTAAVADWLIDPPVEAILFGNGTLWLIYPLLYIIYTLVRGRLTGWYPAMRLDPSQTNPAIIAGEFAVLVIIALCAIGLLVRPHKLTRVSHLTLTADSSNQDSIIR